MDRFNFLRGLNNLCDALKLIMMLTVSMNAKSKKNVLTVMIKLRVKITISFTPRR